MTKGNDNSFISHIAIGKQIPIISILLRIDRP